MNRVNTDDKKGVQQIMLGKVTKDHDSSLAALKRIKAAGYDYIELNDFMVQKASRIDGDPVKSIEVSSHFMNEHFSAV